MDKEQDYAAGDINRVELYLMFSTDLDFGINLDGLESFIWSRLGDDTLKYDFRASEILLGDYDDKRFVKLSVEFPWWKNHHPHLTKEQVREYFKDRSWAEDAVEQVLLPAYMWVFAEIGIANRHSLSKYFRLNPFNMLHDGTIVPIWNWLKSEFTDGVRLLPRIETMSGNYENSWAQFRFVLDGAKDYGDSKEYIESVKDELKKKY